MNSSGSSTGHIGLSQVVGETAVLTGQILGQLYTFSFLNVRFLINYVIDIKQHTVLLLLFFSNFSIVSLASSMQLLAGVFCHLGKPCG